MPFARRQKCSDKRADEKNPEHGPEWRKVLPFERAQEDEPAIGHQGAIGENQQNRGQQRHERGPRADPPHVLAVALPECVADKNGREHEAGNDVEGWTFHCRKFMATRSSGA